MEKAENQQPKRLYQITEGSVLTGVCNGIATYFGINSKLVRAIFVLLALLTNGLWILAYAALVVTMPVAWTELDYARARGEAAPA